MTIKKLQPESDLYESFRIFLGFNLFRFLFVTDTLKPLDEAFLISKSMYIRESVFDTLYIGIKHKH